MDDAFCFIRTFSFFNLLLTFRLDELVFRMLVPIVSSFSLILLVLTSLLGGTKSLEGGTCWRMGSVASSPFCTFSVVLCSLGFFSRQ